MTIAQVITYLWFSEIFFGWFGRIFLERVKENWNFERENDERASVWKLGSDLNM